MHQINATSCYCYLNSHRQPSFDISLYNEYIVSKFSLKLFVFWGVNNNLQPKQVNVEKRTVDLNFITILFMIIVIIWKHLFGKFVGCVLEDKLRWKVFEGNAEWELAALFIHGNGRVFIYSKSRPCLWMIPSSLRSPTLAWHPSKLLQLHRLHFWRLSTYCLVNYVQIRIRKITNRKQTGLDPLPSWWLFLISFRGDIISP